MKTSQFRPAAKRHVAARILAIAALCAGPFAVAIPAVHAQQTDENLRCAAWAFVVSAQEKDQAKKNALGFMMTYFMGRYEQTSGAKVDQKINPQSIAALVGNVQQANALCGPKAKDFGTRLQQTIEGMQAPAKAEGGR